MIVRLDIPGPSPYYQITVPTYVTYGEQVVTRTYTASIRNQPQESDDLHLLGSAASKLWNVGRWVSDRVLSEIGHILGHNELTACLKSHERRVMVIHGHHHDNDTAEYPFLVYNERRINVSSELLAYRPVTLQSLVELLGQCPSGTRLRDFQEAKEHSQAKDSDP